MKTHAQHLLMMEPTMFLAWENARSATCPRCDNMGIWILNSQRCFCIECHYEWDRIDIYAPVLMDGSGIAT